MGNLLTRSSRIPRLYCRAVNFSKLCQEGPSPASFRPSDSRPDNKFLWDEENPACSCKHIPKLLHHLCHHRLGQPWRQEPLLIKPAGWQPGLLNEGPTEWELCPDCEKDSRSVHLDGNVSRYRSRRLGMMSDSSDGPPICSLGNRSAGTIKKVLFTGVTQKSILNDCGWTQRWVSLLINTIEVLPFPPETTEISGLLQVNRQIAAIFGPAYPNSFWGGSQIIHF